MIPRLRPIHWIVLTASLCALGCAGKTNIGENHDAGVDAPTRTGPYDECGNGMDDDGDGQIDEDCFCGGGETQPCFTGIYPNRGVGACADGVQTCDATSTTEFGHWGACTMDTLPAEEACDGVDNDCDGAVDEGCPCTAGQTQGCGSEFAIAPCSAGTQTCASDGTWSACEGAIGPSAEVCGTGAGDGIDNDCDGETDEGCGCVPEPEVCRDGVDNDCDGTVDEASCRTVPVDGGVDGSDGGMDAASDSGPLDAGVDTGPIGLAACPVTSDLRWDRVSRPADGPVLASGWSRSVWTGSESVFLFATTADGQSSDPKHLTLSRYDASGSHIDTVVQTDVSLGTFDLPSGLVFTGTELVVSYEQGIQTIIRRAGVDLAFRGDSLVFPGIQSSMVWNGSELGILYRQPGAAGGVYLQVYDASLSPLGAALEVVAPGGDNISLELGGQTLVWTGRRWLAAWENTDQGEVWVATLTDSRVESMHQPSSPSGGAGDGSPALGAGDDSAMVCWHHVYGMWDYDTRCERLDGIGASTAPPIVVAPRRSSMGAFVGVIRWGGGYVIINVDATPGFSSSLIWRDVSETPESLPLPPETLSKSGWFYWESRFGLIQGGPDSLLLQGRGDLIAGDPVRRGTPPSRVRLSCPSR